MLRKMDYQCRRPMVVTVDTSPIAIGWAIRQDDVKWQRFAIRFGAKILTRRQRANPQVKRKLWRILNALKAKRNYPIETKYGFGSRFFAITWNDH